MSFSELFAPFFGTALGARWPRAAIVALLTVFTTCIAATDGNAASTSAGAFMTMQYFVPASSDEIDDSSSTSFASRFQYPQSSMLREVIERSIDRPSIAPLTIASRPRQRTITPAASAIVGTASTYNPNNADDRDSGDKETASGELYDAEGWTAAIRTDLRERFGGVRYGKNYQPAFALVQTSEKQAIVRINDTGPLKPDRIIDLNERAMRYFDPTMQLGLLTDVKVTFLAGEDWTPGPVADEPPVTVAGHFEPEWR